MSEMIDLVKKRHGNVLTPIFITCDPAPRHPRSEYLIEFHLELVGLTGTYDQIKKVCESYRV
ncbi:Cu-binding protein [Rhizina undulata]